jgi:hypothetical protein
MSESDSDLDFSAPEPPYGAAAPTVTKQAAPKKTAAKKKKAKKAAAEKKDPLDAEQYRFRSPIKAVILERKNQEVGWGFGLEVVDDGHGAPTMMIPLEFHEAQYTLHKISKGSPAFRKVYPRLKILSLNGTSTEGMSAEDGEKEMESYNEKLTIQFDDWVEKGEISLEDWETRPAIWTYGKEPAWFQTGKRKQVNGSLANYKYDMIPRKAKHLFVLVKFVDANFTSATFENRADFYGALFEGDADFSLTRFNGEADFEKTTFKGKADFRSSSFAAGVSSRMKGAIFNGIFDCSFADLGDLDMFMMTINGADNFECNNATNLAQVCNLDKLTLFKDDDADLKPFVPKNQDEISKSCCKSISGATSAISDGYERIGMPFFQSWFVRSQYYALQVDGGTMNMHKVS